MKFSKHVKLKIVNDSKIGSHVELKIENKCHGVKDAELISEKLIPHSFIPHSFISHSHIH